jgi:hypothetical protein
MELSLSGFARRKKVSAQAVSKAVDTGRLDKSVVTDTTGRRSIEDVDLADREWAANRSRPAPMQDAGLAGNNELTVFMLKDTVVIGLCDFDAAGNPDIDTPATFLPMSRDAARLLAERLFAITEE